MDEARFDKPLSEHASKLHETLALPYLPVEWVHLFLGHNVDSIIRIVRLVCCLRIS